MLSRLERLAIGVAALSVLAMGAMITTNVILRLFGGALPDSVVIVQELMIAAIVLPLAVVTAKRAHICVEVLTDLLPARLRRALVPLGWIVGFVALLPLAYAGGREFLSVWQSGGFYFGDLSLPKWPGRLIFVLGLLLCCLRLAVLLIGDLRALRREGNG